MHNTTHTPKGCFDPSKLTLPDRAAPAKFAAYSVRKCAGYCRGQGHALNVITRALECHCTSVIPDEGARLAEASCAADTPAGAPAGVALFYNHLNAAEKGCRLANVKMDKGSFNFHYNDYHASFDNGVMTLKMVCAVCVLCVCVGGVWPTWGRHARRSVVVVSRTPTN
jgi:hypothetical protein